MSNSSWMTYIYFGYTSPPYVSLLKKSLNDLGHFFSQMSTHLFHEYIYLIYTQIYKLSNRIYKCIYVYIVIVLESCGIKKKKLLQKRELDLFMEKCLLSCLTSGKFTYENVLKYLSIGHRKDRIS